MAWACIGLGSNLGNKLTNLQTAVKYISEKNTIINTSPVYETLPYGDTKQDCFYNCVIRIETGFLPEQLLEHLLGIEKIMGRIRTVKWGPRNIDLDIIFYENQVIKMDNLVIPHPDYKNRIFVLKPLTDVIEDFTPPGERRTIKQILLNLEKDSQIKLVRSSWIN